MNAGITKKLISYLIEKSERQQRQNKRFLSLMERMLSPQSPMAAQPSFGWNFQENSFSSVPGRHGVSNQMLHEDDTNHNSFENM